MVTTNRKNAASKPNYFKCIYFIRNQSQENTNADNRKMLNVGHDKHSTPNWTHAYQYGDAYKFTKDDIYHSLNSFKSTLHTAGYII